MTANIEPKKNTGWWNPEPYSFRRRATFHYVQADGKTLCGKWLYIGQGTVEEGQDEHHENCAMCKKKKLKQNEKVKP